MANNYLPFLFNTFKDVYAIDRIAFAQHLLIYLPAHIKAEDRYQCPVIPNKDKNGNRFFSVGSAKKIKSGKTDYLFYWFYNIKAQEANGKKCVQWFLKNNYYWKLLVEDHKKYKKEFALFEKKCGFHKYPNYLRKISLDQLFIEFNRAYMVMVDNLTVKVVILAIDLYAEKEMEKYFNRDDIAALTMFSGPSCLIKFEKNANLFGKEISPQMRRKKFRQLSADIKRKLTLFVRNYHHIESTFSSGGFLNEKQMWKKLQCIWQQGDPSERYNFLLSEEKKKNIKIKNSIKIKIPLALKEKMTIFQYIVKRRDESKDLQIKFFDYWYALLREISQRVKLFWPKIMFLTPEEINMLIKTTDSSYWEKEIEKRMNAYFVYWSDGDNVNAPYIINGDNAKKYINFILRVNDDVKKIVGTPAYYGKVKGRCRVVMGVSENMVFKKGEILITDQTTPEFVPIMKLAKAIVTNVGGITAHAAIVSREMKIPCIIGTKIATKVLKDGDLVEVDANNGVVKILKKAKK